MYGIVRSVWDEPRAPDPPQRLWWDWALVGGVVLLALLEAALRPDLPDRALWALMLVAVAPALLWRRTRPLLTLTLAFVTTAAVPLLTGVAQPDLYSAAALLILPYALFRWGSGREVTVGLAVVLGNIGVSMVSQDMPPGDAVAGLTVVSAIATLGLAVRFRSGARLRELEQVKLLERERLARDLHDTVAHHVSAMAIRAQAGLAMAASRPDAAADALRVIEAEASRTLTEMRTLVRILRRDQPADLAPNPRLRDLARLASPARTGPRVDVELSGDLDDLPQPVANAIYRLAQESVTNSLRHARHATRIEVRVSADDTAVRMRVSDDGEGAGQPAAPGYGLVGMRERVDLLGGTWEAGPAPGQGWTVSAVLPRSGMVRR